MIYRAFSQFTQSLLSLPETGMGYQLIKANRPGRNFTEQFVVYNSELVIELDSKFNIYKQQILRESYRMMFSKSDFLTLENPSLISRNLMGNVRSLSESSIKTKGRHTGISGAVDNLPTYATGTELFVRLSPYPDDKRIDFVKMKLKSGSYTTTNEDYWTCKKYSDDPIDRYALPSDETINWAYFIMPKPFDKYRPGIVQPAFDHNGGGIESLFDNGTYDGTYLERKPY